jgi:hypothetical protein
VKYEEAETMKHFTLNTAGGILIFVGVLAGAAGGALKQTVLLAGIAAMWYGLARMFDPQAMDTALAALGLSGQ